MRRLAGRRQTLRGNAARAASPAHQASSFLLAAAAASGQTPGSTPRRPRLVCELSGGARRKSPSLRAKPSPSLPGAWPASPFPLLFLPLPRRSPPLSSHARFSSPLKGASCEARGGRGGPSRLGFASADFKVPGRAAGGIVATVSGAPAARVRSWHWWWCGVWGGG